MRVRALPSSLPQELLQLGPAALKDALSKLGLKSGGTDKCARRRRPLRLLTPAQQISVPRDVSPALGGDEC